MNASAPSTRRRFLALAPGVALLPLAFATRAAACTLTAEQEEGPFYLPAQHLRSALAAGLPGTALAVRLRVLDAATCAPVTGAAVDLWQCDAFGVYSGYDGTPGPPPGGGPPHGFPPPEMPPRGMPSGGPGHMAATNGRRFLRGIVRTDVAGVAAFTTIFPGYYMGRVNHIHLKVHANSASHAGRHVVHTGQILFPEDVARAISATLPYRTHRIERTTLDRDHVFAREHGSAMVAGLEPSPAVRGGYVATLTVAIDRGLRL